MFRILACLAALFMLAACGGPAEPKWASDESVARAHFVAGPPASVTLFTVLSTKNGSGAHAGLLINGSERIMFDPAGSWHHPNLPERNDVFFGMTDKMVNFYIDYHARETYDVVEQTRIVSPEIAELVMQRAKANGAVAKAHCTLAISDVLRGVPGFEGLPHTWFPKTLMEAYGKLPNVTTRKISDTDADKNYGVLLVQAGDPRLN